MLISVCIPCGNRLEDLKQALPTVIAAAHNSPPVEIVVLDYNSQDGLSDYIQEVKTWTNAVYYRKYTGRDHYHMAHARNLAMLSGSGDYLINTCADVLMKPDYIQRLRPIVEIGYTWVRHEDRFVGIFCVARQEFIDAGGYDERFEFYGKEDKDILGRLERRGKSHVEIRAHLGLLPTLWPDKLKNYRLELTRSEASRRSKAIYLENIDNGVLVANEGNRWGQWV